MSPESVISGPLGAVAGLSAFAAGLWVVNKSFQSFRTAEDPVRKVISGLLALGTTIGIVVMLMKTQLVQSLKNIATGLGSAFSSAKNFSSGVAAAAKKGGTAVGAWYRDGASIYQQRIESRIAATGTASLPFKAGAALNSFGVVAAIAPALKLIMKTIIMSLAASLTSILVPILTQLATKFMHVANDTAVGMTRSGTLNGKALHNMAGMLGIEESQLGSAARNFGELLNQGGIAAGFAAKLGIKPYGGLGGDQDYFAKYTEALKGIAYEKDDRKAGQMARYFGMEDVSWIRNADEGYKKQFFDHQAMAMSPEQLTKAANAQIQFNIAFKDFQDSLMEVGSNFLPVITAALRNFWPIIIGAIVGGILGSFVGMPGVGAVIGGLLAGGVSNAIGSHMDEANRDAERNATVGHTKAMNRHSDALEANTEMMDGSYGGGPLFNGNLVPRGWGMSLIDQAANGRSIALGAFAI